jgi:hypothetical protein
MFQNGVGVAEPVTPVEIQYELDVSEFYDPVEIVLQTMVANGLAEERLIAIPVDQGHPKRGIRLTKGYQVSFEALEELR